MTTFVELVKTSENRNELVSLVHKTQRLKHLKGSLILYPTHALLKAKLLKELENIKPEPANKPTKPAQKPKNKKNKPAKKLTPKPANKPTEKVETINFETELLNTKKDEKMKLKLNLKKDKSEKKEVKNSVKLTPKVKETPKKEVKKPAAKAAKNQVKMNSKKVDKSEQSKQVNRILKVDFEALKMLAEFDLSDRFKDVNFDLTEGEIRAQMCMVVMGYEVLETTAPENETEKVTLNVAANDVEAPVKPKRSKKQTRVSGKKSKAAVMLEYILDLDGDWFSIDELADHVTEVCGEGSTATANKGGAGSYVTAKLPARGYEIEKEEFEEGVFYRVVSTPEA